MTLRRRVGGHVLQRKYYLAAAIGKKRSEQLSPLGPFKVDGKDFVAVAYFDRWAYYKWLVRHGVLLFASFFFPSLYYKTKSLAVKTKGMMILDDKAQFVTDKNQQTRIARIALVWIDVYLCPTFPPKLFNYVNSKIKVEKKFFENCRDRKVPKARSLAEKLYFQELKKADNQVVRFYPILIKYNNLLKNASNLFYGISDKPSEEKVQALKIVMGSLAQNFEELAKWCEERAKSWGDFVDSFELYKKSEERKKGLLKRYGPSAIWTILMSAVAEILTGGNLAFSAIVALISRFGTEGFNMILSFRWQIKMLKNTGRAYHQFSARAAKFSKLYDIPFKKSFLR
jgi:hypothetical protein